MLRIKVTKEVEIVSSVKNVNISLLRLKSRYNPKPPLHQTKAFLIDTFGQYFR